MSITPEQIAENFDKYRAFFEKLEDRAPAALDLVDSLGERLALCPASSRKDFHCAFPGGLVDHSLRVLGNTQTEWLCIRLNDGQYADENAPYKMKEPLLVDAIHMADLISTKQEKKLFT